MAKPSRHSISKGTLCLQPGDYRLIILIRGVSQKNKNQADHHLRVCKNIESLECECHKITVNS